MEPIAEKKTKSNQSLEKALQLIEILAPAREPMRLQDLSKQAGMPPSTALRLLNTLLQHGYVNQDPLTCRYGLTLKFAQIGGLVRSRLDICTLAHPSLLELSSRCGESCCLAVEENQQAVYVDVVDGPDGMLKIMQRIGKRAPLHCTGVGKLFLLNLTQEQVEDYVQRCGLPALTNKTITTQERLLQELSYIRRQGYAMDDEECELGARCVACGVWDYTKRIVASVSVTGPLHRMQGDHLVNITQQVQRTASRLSNMLSYPDGDKTLP